ncbi:MAG: hypothetical protein GF309_03780 [Candidatus Lokiarchaeota archaeon]|nr:hypothetical protein [Candidatus Lokiarchaeota archaeon]
MTWLPEWLGTAYSRLWQAFGFAGINIKQACSTLDMEYKTVLNVMSRLAQANHCIRLRRGLYQMCSPEYIVAKAAEKIQFGRLEDRPHISIIRSALSCLLHHFGTQLVTMAVYGSVSTDNYTDTSDIDILVVADEWPRNISDQTAEVVEATAPVRRAISALYESQGISSSIQWYTLTKEEAAKLRPLYLDMVRDAELVYDRDHFFEDILSKLESRMSDFGVKRVELPDGSHAWEAPSGHSLAEVFED